jgi:hypothetical protein
MRAEAWETQQQRFDFVARIGVRDQWSSATKECSSGQPHTVQASLLVACRATALNGACK